MIGLLNPIHCKKGKQRMKVFLLIILFAFPITASAESTNIGKYFNGEIFPDGEQYKLVIIDHSDAEVVAEEYALAEPQSWFAYIVSLTKTLFN